MCCRLTTHSLCSSVNNISIYLSIFYVISASDPTLTWFKQNSSLKGHRWGPKSQTLFLAILLDLSASPGTVSHFLVLETLSSSMKLITPMFLPWFSSYIWSFFIISHYYNFQSLNFFFLFKGRSEVAQSCPTLCDPMGCSLPGFSVHGIFQARILEGVAFLLQGIFPTQGLNSGLLCCRQTLYPLSHQESPFL